MTDKQKKATQVILDACTNGHLSPEDALMVIDAIIGDKATFEYLPIQLPVWPPTPWTVTDETPKITYTTKTYEQNGKSI